MPDASSASAGGPSPSGDRPRASGRGGLGASFMVRAAVALSLLLVVGAGIAGWWWMQRPRLSERKVQQAVVATLQREVPSSFFVTGKLQTTVTSTITNDKVLLPGFLDLNMGTTETTARVPGAIHYGFDVRALRPEDVRVGPGDTVTVTLPALQVHSVAPNLKRMQVRTESGWIRRYDDSRSSTREKALGVAQDALREQGRQHLADSQQPLRNTAEAVELLLAPVLEAAGVRDPVVRFETRRPPEDDQAPRVLPPTG